MDVTSLISLRPQQDLISAHHFARLQTMYENKSNYFREQYLTVFHLIHNRLHLKNSFILNINLKKLNIICEGERTYSASRTRPLFVTRHSFRVDDSLPRRKREPMLR